MNNYIYTDAFKCPKNLVVRDCYIRQSDNGRVQALAQDTTNAAYRAEVLDTPENREAVLSACGYFLSQAGEYVSGKVSRYPEFDGGVAICDYCGKTIKDDGIRETRGWSNDEPSWSLVHRECAEN